MTGSRSILKILPAASQRIKEQADYYKLESGPTLAYRWRAAVDYVIRSLRVMPERGSQCNFRTRSLVGLRWMPIEGFPKHRLFYRFDDPSHVLLIVNVLHGARDIERELAMDADKVLPS